MSNQKFVYAKPELVEYPYFGVIGAAGASAGGGTPVTDDNPCTLAGIDPNA